MMMGYMARFVWHGKMNKHDVDLAGPFGAMNLVEIVSYNECDALWLLHCAFNPDRHLNPRTPTCRLPPSPRYVVLLLRLLRASATAWRMHIATPCIVDLSAWRPPSRLSCPPFPMLDLKIGKSRTSVR